MTSFEVYTVELFKKRDNETCTTWHGAYGTFDDAEEALLAFGLEGKKDNSRQQWTMLTTSNPEELEELTKYHKIYAVIKHFGKARVFETWVVTFLN